MKSNQTKSKQNHTNHTVSSTQISTMEFYSTHSHTAPINSNEIKSNQIKSIQANNDDVKGDGNEIRDPNPMPLQLHEAKEKTDTSGNHWETGSTLVVTLARSAEVHHE